MNYDSYLDSLLEAHNNKEPRMCRLVYRYKIGDTIMGTEAIKNWVDSLDTMECNWDSDTKQIERLALRWAFEIATLPEIIEAINKYSNAEFLEPTTFEKAETYLREYVSRAICEDLNMEELTPEDLDTRDYDAEYDDININP